MPTHDFPINANDFGLPTREEFLALRIWDTHYHGFNDIGSVTAADVIPEHHKTLYYAERMGLERVIALDIGGIRLSPIQRSPVEAEQRRLLEEQSDRLSGMIRIEPSYPEESVEKMVEWIANGPCIGIKYAGFNDHGIRCDHPNNDPIIQAARDMAAVVYIHTWVKVGGTPRRVGGANNPGESTPESVVALAKRFPDVPLICGHSGGDWELAVRTVRPQPNVLFEFSGSDPHSGSADFAVKELGADRIVWGGHGPSRSYATELGKILDADTSHADWMKMFGGNFRRIAAENFRRKGKPIVV